MLAGGRDAIGNESVFLDEYPVFSFDQLDRHVGEIADRIRPNVLPVAIRAAALSRDVVEFEMQE